MIGIYKITNLVNGKCYVGQSVRIERRWKEHKEIAFNENEVGYSYPLYQAIRKYRLENFSFEVLEECKKDELEKREIFYIDKYDSYKNGYNQNAGGAHVARHCRFTDEDVDAVIERLKTTLDSTKKIAEDLGVSTSTIRALNRGEYYRRESEVYPIRENVLKLRREQRNLSQTCCENSGKKRWTKGICPNCGAPVFNKGSLCAKCYGLSKRKVERPEPLELARMIKELGFTETGKMFGVDGNSVKKWCKKYGIPHTVHELVSWYNNRIGLLDTLTTRGNTDNCKPVKQIDMKTGEAIAVFKSLGEAGRAVGKSNGNKIGDVCRGLRNSVYGYFWQFA